MNSNQRREEIIEILKKAKGPINATWLGSQLYVSRQIIVSDIAILRALGHDIFSTPKGYILDQGLDKDSIVFQVACLHGSDLAKAELYSVVDNGGKVLDVIIEHPIYGQLVGKLNLFSRRDVDDFFEHIQQDSIPLLSQLTEGVHLHSISCPDQDCVGRIKAALEQQNILLT